MYLLRRKSPLHHYTILNLKCGLNWRSRCHHSSGVGSVRPWSFNTCL